MVGAAAGEGLILNRNTVSKPGFDPKPALVLVLVPADLADGRASISQYASELLKRHT